ncbi:MAG: hypothetical protein IPG82_10365 [Saprospiraceae bacterium]|nr:hypothetical protein [Saprospiraceae bacterium]
MIGPEELMEEILIFFFIDGKGKCCNDALVRDNWYYREVDFDSEWGLWYRASKDRSFPTLQPFLKAMSHYAIWDDHDYGPNNEGVAYIFKNEAKQIFTNYWSILQKHNCKKGVYTKMSYSDVDFFMMDGRSFRSS